MKIYPSAAEKILGTRLMDDGSYALELGIQNGHATRITMSPQLGHELMDCLAALHDESIVKNSPQIWGARAAAFRNCVTADAMLDMEKKTLLLEFDATKPHRVGVAIRIQDAPKLVSQITAKIEEAK